MSFSLTGEVITQSGTDTSLSGLSAISGVTVTGTSTGKIIYALNTRRLVVSGSLIIDPDVECLVFLNNCPYPNLNYTGTLQIGRKRTSSGRTRYSEGDAIIVNRQATDHYDTVNYGAMASSANGSSFIGYGASALQ